jgi:sirohydrochlorin cobaltochelatase
MNRESLQGSEIIQIRDTVLSGDAFSNKKAILVVSFGTSHRETMNKTIVQIEADIKKAYPGRMVYRAFTSNMIINILRDRDGLNIMSVKEAMLQMFKDGMNEVIVQPTHILNGIENEAMAEEVHKYRELFQSVKVGSPLLTATVDFKKVIKGLIKEFPELQEEEALVYMGHGTTHFSNTSYTALEYMLRDSGYEDVYVATVEAYPALDNVIKNLEKKKYKRIKLFPFMIVSGDHALNDMAGEEEDSWKSVLEKEGYEVSCSLKGLGEYQCIRDIFIEHIAQAR